MNTIRLTREEFDQLLEKEEIWYETDEGEFDAEKGAMYDFPFYLERKGKTYTWIGGYYTGVTGVRVYENEFLFELEEAPVESFCVDTDWSGHEGAEKALRACKKLFPELHFRVEIDDEEETTTKFYLSRE